MKHSRTPGVDEDLHCILGAWSSCELVQVVVDGEHWIAGVAIDEPEHHRRTRLGVAAVVDRRLLSALWGLPEGLPVSEDSLREIDAATLEGHVGLLVDRVDGQLVRRFRPACSVRLVMVKARKGEHAIRLLSQVPPVFVRIAVAGAPPAPETAALAQRRHVGLAVQRGRGCELVIEPPLPLLGSPSVYRWWIAELAYEAWRYAQSAHWTS